MAQVLFILGHVEFFDIIDHSLPRESSCIHVQAIQSARLEKFNPIKAMPPTPSFLTIRALRTLVHQPCISSISKTTTPSTPLNRLSSVTSAKTTTPSRCILPQLRSFSATSNAQATFNQVRRGCRVEQRARKSTSPALVGRPEMKGVCLKTGVVKPKKPNSGQRKTARIRLSSGRVITAYIPGEGMYIYIYIFFFPELLCSVSRLRCSGYLYRDVWNG